MYLYTARFSRRRCESERGTDVRGRPNTRVFAAVLSHSRIYRIIQGGEGPQPKVLYRNEARRSREPLRGGMIIIKKKNTVWFYFIYELGVNE